MMGRLDGKVAIITGGSSGIGEGTVRLFVEEGARVIIADVADELGQSLAEECGSDTVYQHTDVSVEAEVAAVVDQAVDSFGRLDCLMNNAGIGGPAGWIEEVPVEEFDATVGVNLRGVFLGTKHAARVMKPQGSGSIINIGSVAGLMPGWGTQTYNACKAAVIHLTRTAALQLGQFGVRLNCIAPGAILTPIFIRDLEIPPEDWGAALEALRPVFEDAQAIPRAGVPEDIARAAVWLAGDESGFVNGACLRVDGGTIGHFHTPERLARGLEALGVDPADFGEVIY
jgi:NAD(P)-dependent dehydrogenase (short-subunit alcohol dehydrogenase family)